MEKHNSMSENIATNERIHDNQLWWLSTKINKQINFLMISAKREGKEIKSDPLFKIQQ